ncbi:hypothetical protein DFH11DRAFT_1636209, partial [Phellopilus nigrolimitatus]
MDPVRNITPGSGAYQNEADVFEPNHEESYWGSNMRHCSPLRTSTILTISSTAGTVSAGRGLQIRDSGVICPSLLFAF